MIGDVLLCGDIEEEYGNVQFLVIYGWRPYFDLIFQNPLYTQKVFTFISFIFLNSNTILDCGNGVARSGS
jgi:hypothetical protein